MTPESTRYPSQHGRWRYEVRAVTAAPRAAVWPLIGEAVRWKDWSFMTRTYLLREGSPVPDGVGALRRFAVGPFGSSEEVVEFEPPAHLGYVARKGIPVRSYRGDIVLQPDGQGTSITWTASLEPLLPGTGRIALAYTHSYARLFARELVRYCDRLAASS
ncbi:MAG: SRPBCC family protein [Streptosporangiaceae bacterium]